MPSGPEIIARHVCIAFSHMRAQMDDETETGSPPPIMSVASSVMRLARAASCEEAASFPSAREA